MKDKKSPEAESICGKEARESRLRLLTKQEHAARSEYVSKNKIYDHLRGVNEFLSSIVKESKASRPKALGELSDEDALSLQETMIAISTTNLMLLMAPLYLKDNKETEAWLNYLYDTREGLVEVARRLARGQFSYEETGVQ